MKKDYNSPIIEIEQNDFSDVILTSGQTFGGNSSWENDDVFDWTF